MALIPRSGDVPMQPLQSVQVQPSGTGYQSTAVPAGAFGSGAGLVEGAKKLDQFSDQLEKLALKQMQEDNEAEAREADVRVSAAIRSLTYGTPDKPGYFSVKGKDALDSYANVEDGINKAIAGAIEGASSDNVKRMLSRTLNARREQALEQMTSHAAKERVDYMNGLSAAREAGAQSDAALSWNSDKALDASLGIIAAEGADWAKRNGRLIDKTNPDGTVVLKPDGTPEKVMADEASVRTLRSQSIAVKSAFDAALANGDTVRAHAIMSKYSNFLDGPTKVVMEKEIKADTDASRAQSLAESAMAKFPGDVGKQRDYIRSVADGKAEDEALTNLDRRIQQARGDQYYAEHNADRAYTLKQRAEAEVTHQRVVAERKREDDLRSARASLGDFLYNRGGTIADFRKQNPEAYTALAGEKGELESWEKTQRSIQEGQLFAGSSDGQTLEKLRTAPLNERANADLNALRSKLTHVEYNQAVGVVASAKDNLQKMQDSPEPYRQGERAIDAFAPAAYGRSNTDKKRSPEKKQVIDDAKTQLNDWIGEQLRVGKRPSQQEIEQEAARLMLRVSADPSGLFNSFDGLASQRASMTPEQLAVARVARKDIPQSVVTYIREKATKYGIAKLDDDTLEQMAGALAVRDLNRLNALAAQARKGGN